MVLIKDLINIKRLIYSYSFVEKAFSYILVCEKTSFIKKY